MLGRLHRYGPEPAHTVFVGEHGGPRHLIVVGGLSDGLLCCQYVKPLASLLEGKGWTTVQPLLRSSLDGWGLRTLDEDAEDLVRLLSWLKLSQSSRGFVIMGHSTGCQDAVRLAEKLERLQGRAVLAPSDAKWAQGDNPGNQGVADGAAQGVGTGENAAEDELTSVSLPPFLGIILQAPVSDREAFPHLAPSIVDHLPRARELVDAGKEKQIVTRWGGDFEGAPVTAGRLCSLCERLGDDDMFSSDFTNEELTSRLGHLSSVPTLMLLSKQDDCYPEGVSPAVLGCRLAEAAGPQASAQVIDGGHSLRGCEAEVAETVVRWITMLDN